MTTPAAVWAPVLDEPTLRGRVSQWRADPKRHADVLLLSARPVWAGPDILTFGSDHVHVVNGISQLAILDAYRARPNAPLVVLTDLDDAEVGSAVRLRAEKHSVQAVDAWDLVPALFKVADSAADRSVRDLGAWLPPLLLTKQRAAGWPVATGGTLSAEHVIRSILADILDVHSVDEVDLVALLDHLDEPQSRARLQDYSRAELDGIVAGTAKHLGEASALALRAGTRAKAYSTLAVAVVVDLLWNRESIEPARIRMERFFDTGLQAPAAKLLGEAARAVVLRREASADPDLDAVLRQAEAIFGDLDWPEGALASSLLPAGLEARYAAFADAVSASVVSPTTERANVVESALASVRAHQLAHHAAEELLAAEMATRLVRWLAAPKAEASASLDDALERYTAGSSWADRARSVIWNGSSRPALTRAYSEVAVAVAAAREIEDAAAAGLLTGETPDRVIPVESMVSNVIEPIAATRDTRVLIIVLDGMSAAVAGELADDVRQLRWVELVPEAASTRLTAIATLPTVTRFSRSSLFAGRLTDGSQATEKADFRNLTGGRVYHKDDLRSHAGALLPDAVERTIADRSQKVVAVVLNTIDDALAKADPDATRWSLQHVANLPALLAEASAAGRIVVLTSDHGHVIERGGELRSASGGGARWRPADSGPVEADEVLVTGPRVLAPGNRAVLARSEGLRYTPKAAGYHGGASLAELTVPIIVLRPPTAKSPAGWKDAPPQAPEWWYESTPRPEASPTTEAEPRLARSKRRPPRSSADLPAMFDLPEPAAAPVSDAPTSLSLGRKLCASERFADQQRRFRHTPEPDIVARVIDAAAQRAGRIHRDVLASILGLAPAKFDSTLSVLRRVLNVDGYDVISLDLDDETVRIDTALLSDQFGLE